MGLFGDLEEAERNREIAEAAKPWIADARRLREVLSAVDHTLTAHGHVDMNTPLHDRIRDVLTETR